MNSTVAVIKFLPTVDWFFGMNIDVKTGSLIVAFVCIVCPLCMVYKWFVRTSFLLLSISILSTLHLAASVMLLGGILMVRSVFVVVWLWASMLYVLVMFNLVVCLALSETRSAVARVFIVTTLLWIILLIYFIIVVNSLKIEQPSKEHHDPELYHMWRATYPTAHRRSVPHAAASPTGSSSAAPAGATSRDTSPMEPAPDVFEETSDPAGHMDPAVWSRVADSLASSLIEIKEESDGVRVKHAPQPTVMAYDMSATRTDAWKRLQDEERQDDTTARNDNTLASGEELNLARG